MTDHKQRARELLAAEYEAAGATPLHVTEVRSGEHDTFADRAALRAIAAALAQSAQQDVSDSCAISGCHHKAFACPTWPEGTNPFTQQAVAVPEGFVALVSDIAGQKPEKPDHWNSCSQCERNIEAAQDLLTHAPPAPSGGWRSIEGECVEIGDDEEGQPRILIHTTRDAIKGGPPLAFRRVIVAPAPVKQEGVDRG